MTDLGRCDSVAAPDDRGSFRTSDRGEGSFERRGLNSGRWLWLMVLNLAAGAAIEECRYTTGNIGDLNLCAMQLGQWSLSLPLAWVAKTRPHLNYHLLFVLNAPIWALLVEGLVARFIARRCDQMDADLKSRPTPLGRPSRETSVER